MIKRLRDESGFGLLELLIAMVILNVGLFALVGAFNGTTVAISRAATVSAATAVADKQMEIYRSYADCAIWLDPASFPAKDSGSAYQADVTAYGNQVFFDKSQTPLNQSYLPWATLSTSSTTNVPWNGDVPTSCKPVPPSPPSNPLTASTTPTFSATQAIQNVPAADGTLYPVYTYITIVQPAGGTWEKQVTIVVRDPKNVAKIIARQTSLFAPSEAPGEL